MYSVHISAFRRTHSKRLYVPALISLSLLPLLFFQLIAHHHKLKKYYAMEVVTFSPKEIDRLPSDMKNMDWRLQKRNYLAIKLNGDEGGDKAKLTFVKYQLQQLIAEKDTVNGVHISFGDSAKYESLVKAFTICFTDNQNQIAGAFYSTHIWAFYRTVDPRPIKSYASICGGVRNTRIESWDSLADERSTWFKIAFDKATDFWPSLVVLFFLVFINGWAIVKRIRLANSSY